MIDWPADHKLSRPQNRLIARPAGDLSMQRLRGDRRQRVAEADQDQVPGVEQRRVQPRQRRLQQRQDSDAGSGVEP
jgi:hypothetical protein